MPDKERCRIWTRRLAEANHRYHEAEGMVRDAEMPDDDDERKNRMQAWADVEYDLARTIRDRARTKHHESCGESARSVSGGNTR